MNDDRSKFGLIDLSGERFGRLVVLGPAPTRRRGAARWLCHCDCGVEKDIEGSSLRNGVTVSCGCLGREKRLAAHTRHGAAARDGKLPEYVIWTAMKARCLNPDDPNFHHYGERGITVCDRWRDDFAAFFSDMGARPSPHHTVERQDNGGNYEPSNCAWATMTVQARNKRTNVAVVRDDGVVFGTMVEAAESVGIHATGVRAACTGKQKRAGGHTWKFADAALLRALISRTPATGGKP